jgi:hypothetical protein
LYGLNPITRLLRAASRTTTLYHKCLLGARAIGRRTAKIAGLAFAGLEIGSAQQVRWNADTFFKRRHWPTNISAMYPRIHPEFPPTLTANLVGIGHAIFVKRAVLAVALHAIKCIAGAIFISNGDDAIFSHVLTLPN